MDGRKWNSDRRARWIFRSGDNGEPPEGFVQKKDNLICGLDRVIWQNVPGQLEEWTRDQLLLPRSQFVTWTTLASVWSLISQSANTVDHLLYA